MSAFFAQVAMKKDPASGDRTIGGTAVEGRKPFYEVIFDNDKGDVKHAKTGLITAPQFPFLMDQPVSKSATRRERLANWITSPENPYFASSYVNRIWGYLTGVGMIEPLDDIRAGNPPSNPELLEWLTDNFVQSGFNVEALIRTICSSRTYQLSIKTNSWNVDDQINFSHAKARRLPAEVLYDAIYQVTGSVSKFPGVEPGTRAAQLPDVGVKLADGFLATLGRPARESACECERSGELQLGSIMSLISGPTVDRALTDSENILAELAESEMGDSDVIQELFLRILNRPATEKEVQESLSMIEAIDVDHEKAVAELVAYEMKYGPIHQQRILDREESIIAAKEQLAQYETEIAPREAELDANQAEEIAEKKSELKAYESTLPQKIVSWEHQWNTSPHWVGLVAESVRSTNGSDLVVEDEHSIFASGENGQGDYVITAKSGMEKITGVRLELLTDDRLPKKGPGRFKDGNFVLTEFIVEWAGASQPDTFRAVALQNAKADFSQQGFDVETAIDGKVGSNNNGWGSSPKLGVNRVAVFEFKEPIEKAGDAALKFTLKQNYLSNKHSIGKFRISLINGESSLEFGVPNRIGSILKIAQEQRNEEEQKKLIAYVGSTDKERQKRKDSLKKAEKARPIDPELKSRQETLVRVEEALTMDPDLKAFRRAADLSYEQTRNKRLTAAQDIAWALINNPAFLFNH
ncbi:MAG TPA: DUF1553 domain-containing protein [Verrucomicrobiales bacterium]|nr:DUF1553 domain-containing protein [Verrucomicrobiales bacterium]